jgi:predicted GNAT family acetyltransferase
MEPNVIHNTAQHRYEIWLGDEKAGHLDYSLMLGEIHFVHTEVDPAHQGKNKVVPVCSYTVRYMEKHVDTQDLLKDPIDEAAAACRLPNVAKASAKLGLPTN